MMMMTITSIMVVGVVMVVVMAPIHVAIISIAAAARIVGVVAVVFYCEVWLVTEHRVDGHCRYHQHNRPSAALSSSAASASPSS